MSEPAVDTSARPTTGRFSVAVLTTSAALAAVLVAVGAAIGLWGLVLAVAVVQVALAVGWAATSDLTGVWPGATLGGGAGICADLLLAFRHNDPLLLPVVGVVAAGFIVAVLGQLARRPPRAALVPLLTTTVAALVVSAAGSLWIGTARVRSGRDLVVVLALGAAGAALGAAMTLGLPVPESVAPVVAAAAGVLAGAAAAVAAAGPYDVGLWSATRAGGVIGGLLALGTFVARYSAAPRAAAPLLTASVPVLLAGPTAYVLAHLLAG